jgi:translation initiation factor 1
VARGSNTRLAYSTGDGGGDRRKRRNGQSTPEAQPRSRGIRLRLDRRASGRVVTLVMGLPGSRAEIATMGRALRSACGTGGTAKDGVVELQGDHRDAVEAFLAQRGLKSKRAGG